MGRGLGVSREIYSDETALFCSNNTTIMGVVNIASRPLLYPDATLHCVFTWKSIISACECGVVICTCDSPRSCM